MTTPASNASGLGNCDVGTFHYYDHAERSDCINWKPVASGTGAERTCAHMIDGWYPCGLNHNGQSLHPLQPRPLELPVPQIDGAPEPQPERPNVRYEMGGKYQEVTAETDDRNRELAQQFAETFAATPAPAADNLPQAYAAMCELVLEHTARIHDLEAALRKYGTHGRDCPRVRVREGGTNIPCDCGYSAAMEKTP